MRVKVGDLNGGRLFEQGLLLGIGRNENSTLVRIFLDQITTDGARLVEDEAIIVLGMAMQLWVSIPALNSKVQRTM